MSLRDIVYQQDYRSGYDDIVGSSSVPLCAGSSRTSVPRHYDGGEADEPDAPYLSGEGVREFNKYAHGGHEVLLEWFEYRPRSLETFLLLSRSVGETFSSVA